MLSRAGHAFVRVSESIFGVGGVISSLAVLIVMVSVTADITARAALNHPIPGVFELSQMLMVVIVFFSFALCESRAQHIRVDSVAMRLSPRTRLYLELLALIIGLFFYSMIGYGSFEAAFVSMQDQGYTGGTVAIPLYPSKFCITIGSLMLIIQYCIGITRTITGIFHKEGSAVVTDKAELKI